VVSENEGQAADGTVMVAGGAASTSDGQPLARRRPHHPGVPGIALTEPIRSLHSGASQFPNTHLEKSTACFSLHIQRYP